MVVLGAALTVAACSSPEEAATKGPERPLSVVSPTPSLPSNSRTPGPALRAVCPLLKPAEVSRTLGIPLPAARELNFFAGGYSPAERKSNPIYGMYCRYQVTVPTPEWVELFVDIQNPAKGTAEQQAQATQLNYAGSLHTLSGIGDYALVTGDQNSHSAAAAQLQGKQMRVVTLIVAVHNEPESRVVALLRLAAGRL